MGFGTLLSLSSLVPFGHVLLVLSPFLLTLRAGAHPVPFVRPALTLLHLTTFISSFKSAVGFSPKHFAVIFPSPASMVLTFAQLSVMAS